MTFEDRGLEILPWYQGPPTLVFSLEMYPFYVVQGGNKVVRKGKGQADGTRRTKEANVNVRAALEIFIALCQIVSTRPSPPPLRLPAECEESQLQTRTNEFQT